MEREKITSRRRLEFWPLSRNVCRWKRLTILLALLITTVMGVKADGYVTDVMVFGSSSKNDATLNQYTSQGWIKLAKDLNDGSGGWYIYLLYKTSTTADPETGYVTDILVCTSKMDSFDYGGRHYTKVKTNSGFGGDLNEEASGEYIYMYITHDRAGLSSNGGQKRVINGISTSGNYSSTSVQWYNSKYTGAADMNEEAGGDFIYINLSFTKQKLSITNDPTFHKNLVYTGQALDLVQAAASGNKGTMKYSVDGSNYSEKAQATTVGNHTVSYRLESDYAEPSDSRSVNNGVNIYPVMKAKNLKAVFSQKNKNVTLTWGINTVPGNYTNYKWVVYRGNTKLTNTALAYNKTSFVDTGFPNEQDVTYKVYYIPAPRDVTKTYSDAEASVSVNTTRSVPVNSLKGKSEATKVTLTWTSIGYPSSVNMNNKFDVYIDDEKVTTITPTENQTSFSWEHRDNNKATKRTNYSAYSEEDLDVCSPHTYRVVGQIDGKELNSATVKDLAVNSGTSFENIECSKGEYQGTVLLKWNVKPLENSKPTYVIERRVLSQEDNEEAWQKLTTLDSDKTFLTWEDKTPLPGVFYEYRITCYTSCGNGGSSAVSATDTGFAMSSGVVSGRITYGTGTAVSDVKVTLRQNNENGETFNHMRSLQLSGAGAGFRCTTTNNEMKKLMAGDFTIQAYVNPDNDQMNTNEGKYFLLDIQNCFSLKLEYNSTAKNYKLGANGGDNFNNKYTSATIPAKKWSHVSCVYKKSEKKLFFYVTTDADHIVSDSLTNCVIPVITDQLGLSLGNTWGLSESSMFGGNLDEFRFFKRALTKTEIGKNYNHPMGGIEEGLAVYYPMDENMGVQSIVYDFSKSNNTSNGHHAKANVPAQSSEDVPSEEQLSLMSLTDAQGNYVVRGVPFSGEGTNYTVIPSYGIHKFSPTYLSRYVSASSLVHSGVDFEDVSSFPVSGKVRYAGTDYPVEGCYIYVDGQMCAKNGEPITTNAEGEFTVSVPIGDHYLEIRQNGHTFAAAGRYPDDPNGLGLTHPFEEEINGLEFIDETLANFTGRVVGGSIEGEKPVGFGLSENNIGVVKLVLSPVNEKYRMNVVKTVTETTSSLDTNTKEVTVPSATAAIKSTSKRGKDADFCRKIYIETDSATGEFSAMLPPLQYKVESMTVVAQPSIKLGANPTIDLSNPQRVLTDSTRNEKGDLLEYEYVYMLRQVYHSAPSFSVVQKGSDDGHFGIDHYKITDNLGDIEINDIYSVNAQTGAVTYNYGGAVFVKDDPYTFLLSGYEEYTNMDGETPVTSRVPMSGIVVTIDNALSDGQSVYAEGGEVDGKTVKAGEVVELQSNQMQLDDEGKGTYTWSAGLPNISEPYTRTINMSFVIDGNTSDWSGNGLKGIILGEMPTGSNFVTAGPDQLLMILRDPPGSESSAEWTTGSSTTKSTTKGDTFSESFSASNTFRFGYKEGIITGTPAVGTITTADSKNDLKVGVKQESEGENSKTNSTTTSIETTIATKGMGDVFIGNATNVIFGKARMLNFQRNEGGGVKLGLKDIMTTGLRFGTAFNYSETYIEETLLPNWVAMRNQFLTHVDSQDEIDNYKNTKNRTVYLTLLTEDDEDYGKQGTYKQFPPANMDLTQKVVDVDSVCWVNTQISNWIKYLEFNEEEKVLAFENRGDNPLNYSFDSGADVSYSITTEKTHTSTWEWSVAAGAVVGDEFGFEIKGLGFQVEIEAEATGGRHEVHETESTDVSSFSFTLSEDGDYDALSVDVYTLGVFSPIFRTRGGQTSDPYEGEVRTKYYKDDKGNHPIIMEATMQIEVPKITVDVPTVNNIPSGEAANYVLQLSNASEIGADVTYRLMLLDETNPGGAQLTIDGMPLTGEGRLIKVPGNQTLTKALQLRQTNTGVLDYEKIAIAFASDSQPDEIFDVVEINAHFVPSASAVDLALSNNIMNTQTGTDLRLTFKNFDRNYTNQKRFQVQYKKQGSTDWTLLHEYVVNDADLGDNNEKLPNTADVSYTLDMNQFSDGDYLFRVLSVAKNGGDLVYRSSEELSLVKDMQRPRPLGQPEPADGVLSPGDELSVTFNEIILKGELTQAQNFKVTGVLNGAELEHETALSLQNADVTAKTEADIMLAGKDFSIDMWVRLGGGGAGTLLSHGKGTAQMSVGTDAENHLVVKLGSEPYTSENAIPTNAWVFLSLSFAGGKLNAYVAKDASEIMLFNAQPIVAYEGDGPLVVGKKFSGAMHELLLWDEAHNMAEALMQRSRTKNPATRHLIGYWKMDEGEGKTIRDYSRNRHMVMSDETWYMNNVNKGVTLANGQYLKVDASALPSYREDDYALEFWMRGDKQTGAAWLLQMGEVGLWLNADGELQLTGRGAYLATDAQNSLATTSGNLADNAWHHIALNVLRQGAAAVYVDGVRRLTTNAANVGSIATNLLMMGTHRKTVSEHGEYTYDSPFTGQVDELRVWNATLNADKLLSNRTLRLTGKEDGLVAYYPFETKQLDNYGQVETVTTNADFAEGSNMVAEVSSGSLTFTNEAPALHAKKTETNVPFTFVASNEKIVITIDEEPAKIEGCTLNFTVRDVRDENGNYSAPAVWSAYVNKNQLVWAENSLNVELLQGTSSTVTATVENKGGQQQMWTLSGMPAWLDASVESGETNPLSETKVELTVLPSAPLGRHEVTVYLKGNDDIDTPLTLNVRVTGNVPEWAVNANDFETSMNIIGQVYFSGVASEDADDILGAFIGEECRGVAHPQYNERYGGYYVTMDIYGSGEESDNDAEVTFRAYDASTGTTYPVVIPGNEWLTEGVFTFSSSVLQGSYAEPVKFNVQNLIEQQIELLAGWNWISFNVKADDMTVPGLFKNIADDVLTVKSQQDYISHENGSWGGDLTGILPNEEMYAVQMKADRKLRVVGTSVTSPVPVYTGWNWIAYYGRQIASIGDALGGMKKVDEDLMRAQRGFAYWDKYEWSGSLQIMEPGQGYQLYSDYVANPSDEDEPQWFSYPIASIPGAQPSPALRGPGQAQTYNTFAPVNFRRYPNNAIMTVMVVDDELPVSNIEVGVFDGEECRTASMTDEAGLAYLTIPGDKACELTFKVVVEGEVMDVPFTITYETDAIYGTPKDPVVFDLGNITGINTAIQANGDESVYDLQGRKIGDDKSSIRTLEKGVYIINGQKTVK